MFKNGSICCQMGFFLGKYKWHMVVHPLLWNTLRRDAHLVPSEGGGGLPLFCTMLTKMVLFREAFNESLAALPNILILAFSF